MCIRDRQKEIKRLTDWIEKWKNTPTKVAATRSKRMAIEHMVKIEKPRRFDTRAFHGRYTPRIESYTNVIQAKDLSIGYDAPLAEVSFLLQKKERLAIIGENGKGKSTLLKTLIGELPALGGSFKFGQNVEWGYFEMCIRDRGRASGGPSGTVFPRRHSAHLPSDPECDEGTVDSDGGFLLRIKACHADLRIVSDP